MSIGTGGSGVHDDYLADVIEEEKSRPWHWTRKCKVFVLTSICIVLIALLLFLPEQISNMNLVTVENDIHYVYDIDQLYNQSRKGPDDTILDVVLKGSFLTPELTLLARHWLQISAVLKDEKSNTNGNGSKNPQFFDLIPLKYKF